MYNFATRYSLLAVLLLPAAFSVQAADGDTVPIYNPVDPIGIPHPLPVKPTTPTLGCCDCLSKPGAAPYTNTISLATIPANAWTVNTNPVAYVTNPNQAWNINRVIAPVTAQWVSTTAAATGGSGPYDEYRLKFKIPNCTIPQKVQLTGILGADNAVQVYLDSAVPTKLITYCNNPFTTPIGKSRCFDAGHSLGQYANGSLGSGVPGSPNPLTISANVGVGWHTLILRVYNGVNSESGMFVNAKLTGICTYDKFKTSKDIPYYPIDAYDNGKLTINVVDVNDGLGGVIKYKASMTLQPLSDPFTFILDQAEQLPADPVQQCLDLEASLPGGGDPAKCYVD